MNLYDKIYITCTLYIIHDRFLPFIKKSLSQVFGRTKKDQEIYFLYLIRKLLRLRGKLSSTALVQSNI